MTIEVMLHPSKYEAQNEGPAISLHETLHLSLEGRIAMDLIARWGMVAATPGEEDSSGRAAVNLLSPEEVVDRAVKITSEFMLSAHAWGWIAEAPSITEIDQKLAVDQLTEDAQKTEEYD